jgi:hypothetical protein
LFDDAAPGDVLLVPGGCDAMRRLGDLLAATYPGRVFVLSLPRSSADEVREVLAGDLARLDAWLCEKAGATAGDAPPAARGADQEAVAGHPAGAAPIKETPQVEYPSPLAPGGVFVVAGPLTDNSLLRLVERLGARISGLESCTSPDRWKPLAEAGAPEEVPPADGRPETAGGGSAARTDFYRALAGRILALGMCPRRSTGERRAHLAQRFDESRPSSVIYARQSFCDPGAYDAVLVAQFAAERGLPFLEIEVGFPFDASGPLHTRVEAFLEAQLLDDDLLDDLDDLNDLDDLDDPTDEE